MTTPAEDQLPSPLDAPDVPDAPGPAGDGGVIVATSAVEHAWQRHRRWSKVADSGHRRLARRRRLNLALLFLGAIGGAVSAQGSWPRGVTATAAAVATVALAAAAAIQTKWLSAAETSRWTAARAASEALKAEVYRYLAGTPPYADANRDAALYQQVDAVEAAASGPMLDFGQTPADDRPLPAVTDLASYISERAQNQADWHRKGIGRELRAARWVRGAEFLATAAAAILAAVGAVLDNADLSVWIGVATTLGAAFAAHLSATRRDRVAASYAATADQLDRLIQRLRPAPDEATRARFVDDVEKVLSVQNESWVVLLKPT